MTDAEFGRLRERHRRLATLFRTLHASGHHEAAEAAFWSAHRLWKHMIDDGADVRSHP